MSLFRQLYLQKKLFQSAGVVIIVFIIGVQWTVIYYFGWMLLATLILFTCADTLLLFRTEPDIPVRKLADRFSNGDENLIQISVENPYPFEALVTIIDEAPSGFQLRNLVMSVKLKPGDKHTLTYFVTPVKRGLYDFGACRAYFASPIGMVQRLILNPNIQEIKVYPSFHHLQVYEMMALADVRISGGTRKIRSDAVSLEFDQIREYVNGDDPRTINWAATARSNRTMVNQYMAERSQSIYMLLDRGRVMKMPFGGMTLFDYSINASLALSRVILLKQDKPGLITFSDTVEQVVKPGSHRSQQQAMMESLYHLSTGFEESNFRALYSGIRMKIPSRSTLILFTNFETVLNLRRTLPIIKSLDKRHLLLVIIFRNSEIERLRFEPTNLISDVYEKALAEDSIANKELITLTLRKAGIRTLLVHPEELSVQVVNRYLQLKRGV